jgi:hypothetical protein
MGGLVVNRNPHKTQTSVTTRLPPLSSSSFIFSLSFPRSVRVFYQWLFSEHFGIISGTRIFLFSLGTFPEESGI